MGLVVAWLLWAAPLTRAWELKVCADPNSLPFSHVDQTGFDNRIARMVAETMGADLAYVWWALGPSMVREYLRAGECDVIVGVPDGYEGLLTTIAYYQSPYVFIYRADRGFDIRSLDDPILRRLRIGVSRTANPPHDALLARGLAGNVVLQFGERVTPDRPDPLADIVQAVARGDVDVGLAWGPVAGYYGPKQPVPLKVVPVTPEIEPPFINMVLAMTMAVRPGDEALRDRLNVVLSERWDDIEAVLRSFGVPLIPMPRPSMSALP